MLPASATNGRKKRRPARKDFVKSRAGPPKFAGARRFGGSGKRERLRMREIVAAIARERFEAQRATIMRAQRNLQFRACTFPSSPGAIAPPVVQRRRLQGPSIACSRPEITVVSSDSGDAVRSSGSAQRIKLPSQDSRFGVPRRSGFSRRDGSAIGATRACGIGSC